MRRPFWLEHDDDDDEDDDEEDEDEDDEDELPLDDDVDELDDGGADELRDEGVLDWNIDWGERILGELMDDGNVHGSDEPTMLLLVMLAFDVAPPPFDIDLLFNVIDDDDDVDDGEFCRLLFVWLCWCCGASWFPFVFVLLFVL